MSNKTQCYTSKYKKNKFHSIILQSVEADPKQVSIEKCQELGRDANFGRKLLRGPKRREFSG